MHLRNFEDLFFIDKVWRRWCVSLEKKTFGAFNWHVYQSLHCSQCPGWIQKISTNCSCSLSLDGSIDFVEHTVCRVRSVSPMHRDFLWLDMGGELRMRWIAGSKAVASTPCATLLLKPRRHFYFHERSYPTIPLLLSHSAKGTWLLLHLHITLIGQVFRKVLNFQFWNGSPQGASARSPCSCQIDGVSSLQNCGFTNNREMQHIQGDATHAETTGWLESVCQCWHHRGHSQTPLPTSLLCGVETCDCEVPKWLLYNLLCPRSSFFK